jgi:transposase-like protein
MSREFDPSTFPRRWGEAHARLTAAAWRESGLTVRAFGRQHGLHEKRLYRWFRRLGVLPRRAQPPAAASFVEVVVADSQAVVDDSPAHAPREQRECFVVELADVRVSVPAQFSPAALATLLQVVRC